jgi:hypothetical protein
MILLGYIKSKVITIKQNHFLLNLLNAALNSVTLIRIR